MIEEEIENIDYVICKECNKKFIQIQYRHLKYSHNMTLVEYKNKYPSCRLQSQKIIKYGKDNPSCKQEVKNKISNKLKGRNVGFGAPGKNNKHSEKTKFLLSQNNSMNNIENRIKVSIGVKKSYKNNDELRKLRSETFKKAVNSEEYKNIMYEKRLWKKPEEMKEYEKYCYEVSLYTKFNFKNFYNEIENANLRSREFHLDHKYSINNGFINNINPKIIGHYKNFEILHHSKNESKNSRNSIEFEELLSFIENSKNKLTNEQIYWQV